MEPIQEKAKELLERLTKKGNCALTHTTIDGKLNIELRSIPENGISESYAEFSIDKKGNIFDPYDVEDPEMIKKRKENPQASIYTAPSKQKGVMDYLRKEMQD